MKKIHPGPKLLGDCDLQFLGSHWLELWFPLTTNEARLCLVKTLPLRVTPSTLSAAFNFEYDFRLTLILATFTVTSVKVSRLWTLFSIARLLPFWSSRFHLRVAIRPRMSAEAIDRSLIHKLFPWTRIQQKSGLSPRWICLSITQTLLVPKSSFPSKRGPCQPTWNWKEHWRIYIYIYIYMYN